MADFSEELLKTRKEKGYKSAKNFYNFLVERGLSCNYSHYMKIEQGGIFPSADLVSQITRALPQIEREHLVLVYCRQLFPDLIHLFPMKNNSKLIKSVDVMKEPPLHIQPSRTQQFLTLQQVFALSQSETHYDIFLFLVLARRPLSELELQMQGFEPEQIKRIIEEFVHVKLARESEEGACLIHTDFAFPSSSTNSVLSEIYKKLDDWDQKIAEKFNFETIQRRTFLRRISDRHLALIVKNLEFTFDLIKSSDEIEKKYNDTVINFQVHLKSGKMPG